MSHIHVVTRNNQLSYVVIPALISKTLNLHIGDYVSINVENNTMVVKKLTHPPTKKELEANLDLEFHAELNLNHQ